MTNVLLLGCGGNAGMNYVRCLKKGDPSINVYGLDTNQYALDGCNVDYAHLWHKDLTNEEKLNYLKMAIEDWNIDSNPGSPR